MAKPQGYRWIMRSRRLTPLIIVCTLLAVMVVFGGIQYSFTFQGGITTIRVPPSSLADVDTKPEPKHGITVNFEGRLGADVDTKPKPKHDITIKFGGRLGNLLFEYASLLAIAKMNHLHPVVPYNLKLKTYFNITTHEFSGDFCKRLKCRKFTEKLPMYFDERSKSLGSDNDVFLDGFFQSWKYVDVIKNEIKRIFSFQEKIRHDAHKQFKELVSEHLGDSSEDRITYVGVHVRRGDMVHKKQYVAYGYTSPSEDYTKEAMKYMDQKYKRVVFVVASDDQKWAKEHVTGNKTVHVHAGNSPILDMAILTKCNHTIMTVGSFGWWIGLLTGGDVIYYGNYPTPNTKLSALFKKEDYYLPHWIKL